MLREVWKSDVLPYIEKETGVALFDGMVVMPADEGTYHVYVFALLWGQYLGGGRHAMWVVDAVTGKYIRRVPTPGLLGAIFAMNGCAVSRKGVLWSKHYYQMDILKVNVGPTASAIPGGEPKTPVRWSTTGDEIPNTHFKTNVAGTEHIIGFWTYALDDAVDIFMNGEIKDLYVATLSTGAFKYYINFPDDIVAICLEDDTRAYLLLNNRTVVLFDYMTGETLGAAKVPPLNNKDRPNYWNNSDVMIAWDKVYRRLLVLERSPDIPGSPPTSTMFIRGFQMVNVPHRLTIPIPLKVPRQGRVIPVLVQVVDDMNHGVGGYVVEAKVT